MACTDHDDVWTCAPGCNVSTPVRNHVRMMSFAGEPSSEIILDSGTDTSALPLSCAHVGESCSHVVGLQGYIDAQGGKLDIKDTCLATVDLGNGVILRERFIIANINSPLLALGHIVRAGWELQHFDDGIYLVKNDKKCECEFPQKLTLCARLHQNGHSGRLHNPQGSCSDTVCDQGHSLRAVLRRLLPGWNAINPQLFALKTRRAKFVDTTVCPSAELMWATHNSGFQKWSWMGTS